MEVKVEEQALFAMEQLLGDQFVPTLEFCFTEFDRLYMELADAIEKQDFTSAVRHAHSLKSNAAQFGAQSLSEYARIIEHTIALDDKTQAMDVFAKTPSHIELTKACIRGLVEKL